MAWTAPRRSATLFYALSWDNTPWLIVVGFGASGVHHLVESLMKGACDPGVITCVLYAVVGYLLVAAVVGELKRRRPVVTAQTALA